METIKIAMSPATTTRIRTIVVEILPLQGHQAIVFCRCFCPYILIAIAINGAEKYTVIYGDKYGH
jgi:hypothetical protein